MHLRHSPSWTHCPRLQEEVAKDQLERSTGRIFPMAANLTVRTRVNWMSNYDVLHAGFNELEKEHGNNRLFTEAVDWWMEIKGLALEKIQSVYVTKSRKADNLADYSYGLPMMGDKIRDQEIPWTTLTTLMSL